MPKLHPPRADGRTRAACGRSGRPDEAVALPGYGRDVAGPAPIVLELRAEVPHMTVNEVALGQVIGAPELVENLFPSHGLAPVRREEIQERLLHRRHAERRRARADALVQQVDLEAGDGDDGHERHFVAVRAAHEGEHPSDELLRAEWDRHDVIHARVERGELRLEIAPFGKGDERKPIAALLAGPDKVQPVVVRPVDVDDHEMRLPERDRIDRDRRPADGLREVDAVIQRELDEPREGWVRRNDEDPAGPAKDPRPWHGHATSVYPG